MEGRQLLGAAVCGDVTAVVACVPGLEAWPEGEQAALGLPGAEAPSSGQAGRSGWSMGSDCTCPGDKWQLLALGAHASPWTEPAATPPRWQHSYRWHHADAVTVRWGGGSSLRAVSRQASAASSWSAPAAAAQPGMGGSQAGALCNLTLACISPGF